MKKNLLIATLAVLSLFSCKPKDPNEWVLVWEDNFDQTDSFDESSWSKIPRGTADWNKFMTDYDSCYAMQDGNLVLRGLLNTTQKEDTATCLTGGVWTMDKVNFDYGRIEIRAKLDECIGAWPAIWMLPQDVAWPNGGEIDIMEHLNRDSIVYQTIHTNYTLYSGETTPPNSGTNFLKNNDYNVYALEYFPDTLKLYTNDSLTLAYPRIKTDKEDQFPFEGDFYLLIDMQLGGSWVGGVKLDELPVEMHIDYVKYYKKRYMLNEKK